MFYQSSFFPRIAVLALAIPVAGFSATIEVTAPGVSVCTASPCAADTLNNNATSSGSFNFSGATKITLSDGDSYSVTGTFFNSQTSANGIGWSYVPVVTYVGAGASAAADTISVQMLENFFNPIPVGGTWDSPPDYTEDFPFALPASGVSATGQACFTAEAVTDCLAKLSASSSGMYTSGAPLNNLNGPNLLLDATATFTFAKNTATGTSASSPISSAPEPAQTIPAGIGLASLFLLQARKLRSKKAN